jgi:hypothetical protein
MVRNERPVYLRLSDGAVLGSPQGASDQAGVVVGANDILVPNILLGDLPEHSATE